MPLIQTGPLNLSQKTPGGNNVGIPSGFFGELVISELIARYSNLCKANALFGAYATLTAPVIFTTAAGTGGPLLWNKPNSGIDAHILAVGFSSSVVTTVAGGIGLTGNSGQVTTPTSTTAIDASGPLYLGGANTQLGGVFRVGTVSNAGNVFIPVAQFHTGALTVDTTAVTWMDVGGAMIVPPGGWGSLAGTATLTTLQVQVGVIWAELPA
jgi:hypothetical protein